VIAWAITINNRTIKYRGEKFYLEVLDKESLHHTTIIPKDVRVLDIIKSLRD
jgi:hypothetical protein